MERVNSYAALTRWLSEDVGDLHDASAIPFTMDLVRRLTERLASDPTLHEPAYLSDLRKALSHLEQLPTTADQLAYLSSTLRRLFLEITLPEDQYHRHAESLFSGESLALRLQSRAPLPTTDAMLLLAADARRPAASQRAALLVATALRHPLSGAAMLGATQVPGELTDEIVNAGDSLEILVLASGLTYVVRLPDSVDAQQLCDAFEFIQQDAKGASPYPIPSLLTAAQRLTCFRVRQCLEKDPAVRCQLQRIDRCRLAVCLDTKETSGSGSLESISRRLFGNFQNRWYGMTMLVVDGHGEAAIIAGYTRGVEALPVLEFGAALYRETLAQPLPIVRNHRLPSIERLDFAPAELSELGVRASSEIVMNFHNEQAFFEIDAGSDYFRSIGASPNAALQYLLMLAGRKVTNSATFPAVSHAVRPTEGGGLKGGIDWIVVSTAGAESLRNCEDDADFVQELTRVANRHSVRVKSSAKGYSPAFFLRRPGNELDDMAYRFFLELGLHHETAYRSYLFRPTRWPQTMDILTSTLKLPEGIRLCGRPGSTCEVASLFGLHILVQPAHTSLFFIPNPQTIGLLGDIHLALQHLVSRLK